MLEDLGDPFMENKNYTTLPVLVIIGKKRKNAAVAECGRTNIAQLFITKYSVKCKRQSGTTHEFEDNYTARKSVANGLKCCLS